MPPITVLFNTWADEANLNSQSLTAREIALRLDRRRFTSRLFTWAGARPDPRLVASAARVELVRVPRRLGSAVIARELLWGRRDAVVYPALNVRASRLFWRLRPLARPAAIVSPLEVSREQLQAEPEASRAHILAWLESADRVTAITPAIVRSLAEQGIAAELAPIGVDLELFRPGEKERRPPRRVIFVGSIVERKQPHLMLELARRLRPRPVEVHLVGPVLDAAYGERLADEKERDGLDRVFFHGPLPQSEIARRLRASDVYVLPSRLEGFGKTTVEAAACGLPAVVFDDYETPAVVDGETGYRVASFEQMCARVEELLDDEALRRRLGMAAREHARAFGWERIAHGWEDRLEELVTGAGR